MGVVWRMAVVFVLAVSSCTVGGADGPSPDGDEGSQVLLRSNEQPDVVIEGTVVGDTARARLRIASWVVAEERRIGRRYFVRIRGVEVLLGVDRWISFDLADRREAAIARRIGPGLIDLIDSGAYDGYDVEHRVLPASEGIPVPSPGEHVPIRSLPEVVRATG